MTIEILVTIIIGIIAVVATVFAPALWQRGRINFTSANRWQVDQTGNVRGLTVKVFHGEKLVDGPVFILFGWFENTGGRDIIKDDFVTPIKVSLPSDCSLISAEFNSPNESMDVECKVDANSAYFSWDMLKPKEKIGIYLIVSAKQRPDKLFSNPRLKNIKVGERLFMSFLPASAAQISVYLTILLFTLVAMGWLIYTDSKYIKVLRSEAAAYHKIVATRLVVQRK